MTKQAPQFWFEWILASLHEGKEVEITAKGWSMWPSIKPGTILTLIKTPIEEIKVGDAIAFTRGEHLVVHRIIHIVNKGTLQIYTKGDANLRMDELVTEQNYCANVSNEIPSETPGVVRRFTSFTIQLLQINWARAKKIPSLLKRDSAI
jgi:signal peptidase I